MPMSWMLRHLLLAWTCLCVCGAPVLQPNFNRTRDSSVTTPGSAHNTHIESVPPDKEHVTAFLLNVGAGGGTGPHGGPEGIDSVTQTENGGSLDGRFGLNKSGGEAWSQRSEVKKTKSTSEMRDPEDEKEDVSVDYEPLSPTGGKEQLDIDMSTPKRTAESLLASSASPSHVEASYSQNSKPGGVDGTKFSSDSFQNENPETSLQSSTEPPNSYTSPWTQKLTSHSGIPPLMFITSRSATPLPIWGHSGATKSSLTDPVLPEIGPNSMPRDDGLESLWTEATKPAGADTAVPLSQDEATEATMSSEALPLIFEPFEDVTAEGAAAAHVPGSAQPPGAMATRGLPLSEVDLDQLVTVETDSDGPSRDPSVLLPDWTSPWQTSGAELLEPVSASGPSVSQRQVETEPEDRPEKGVVRTSSLEENMPSTGPSLSSLQYAMTTVTMATHQLPHKSRSGLEEMESEEEADEDDDDENSEESLEEESEEDLTGAPNACSTQPTYSLIPPPPVWVQRNQGLMRSWVELIREKVRLPPVVHTVYHPFLRLHSQRLGAGYVSGMLAPVGIGITGALLIVGALYSIRMIHRKRRNSFKHQRRKVRQPEQPREPGTSHQDQAMLLADSSEDEF